MEKSRGQSAQAFEAPAPSASLGQALRKVREGRGTHCIGDAREIKSLGHPVGAVHMEVPVYVPLVLCSGLCPSPDYVPGIYVPIEYKTPQLRYLQGLRPVSATRNTLSPCTECLCNARSSRPGATGRAVRQPKWFLPGGCCPTFANPDMSCPCMEPPYSARWNHRYEIEKVVCRRR